MSERVVFYQLTHKFVNQEQNIPESARQVVYYSLAIGHHVGVMDCFQNLMEVPLEDSVLAPAEAVAQDPVPILRAQLARTKDELVARLKAERVPYEERMAKLEEVTWPQPEAEFVRATFAIFAERHPWVSEASVRPKGVVREMLEGYEGFDDAVRRLGIQRCEGLLLRYLGEVLRSIERSVPDASKTDAVHDVLAYLHELVRHTDASLLEEWEARAAGGLPARVRQGMKKGRLKLMAITTASYFAPRLLGEFAKRHPGIVVSLKVTNREQVLASMADNLDDLYLLGQPPEEIDVVAQPFMDNPLVVLAAPGHPLAGKKNIPLKRLAKEPWLMRESGSGTRKAIERLFTEHNLEIRPRLELGSNEAVKQAILAGLGISALSCHALALHQPGQFAVLDAEGFPIQRHGYAVYPRQSPAPRWWRGGSSNFCWNRKAPRPARRRVATLVVRRSVE